MHPDMTDTSGVSGAKRQTLMERFGREVGAGRLSLTTTEAHTIINGLVLGADKAILDDIGVRKDSMNNRRNEVQ